MEGPAYDQRYDPGPAAAADFAVFGADDAGQPVPAVLQHGRHHHRGPLCRGGGAGCRGQRGRPELPGAGLCERHRLRLCHPAGPLLRRPGRRGDAPLHR